MFVVHGNIDTPKHQGRRRLLARHCRSKMKHAVSLTDKETKGNRQDNSQGNNTNIHNRLPIRWLIGYGSRVDRLNSEPTTFRRFFSNRLREAGIQLIRQSIDSNLVNK